MLPKALKPQLHARRAEPPLGRLLRQAWGDGPLVIVGRGTRVVAHYAGARYAVLAHAPLAEAVAEARGHGDLLAIQVRTVGEDAALDRPRELDAQLAALGLTRLRHGFSGHDPDRGRRYAWLIYRLR